MVITSGKTPTLGRKSGIQIARYSSIRIEVCSLSQMRSRNALCISLSLLRGPKLIKAISLTSSRNPEIIPSPLSLSPRWEPIRHCKSSVNGMSHTRNPPLNAKGLLPATEKFRIFCARLIRIICLLSCYLIVFRAVVKKLGKLV